MNKDALINIIAHTTDCSRKEVLDTLKTLGVLSECSKQPIKEDK